MSARLLSVFFKMKLIALMNRRFILNEFAGSVIHSKGAIQQLQQLHSPNMHNMPSEFALISVYSVFQSAGSY